jgi:hypothetical protein
VLLLIGRFLAHFAAAFGIFWLAAFGAHALGIYEDPRIVLMSGWERAVIVLWGLAAAEWWLQWARAGKGGRR